MSISERSRSLLICTLVVPLFSAVAHAQTVDEVIEKHLAASGGREALGKLTSRHSTGTLTVTVNGAEIPGTVEAFAKAPNKMRIAMKLDLTAMGAGEMTIEQRFDGTSGITMNSMQGDSEIRGSQLDAMRNATFPSPLLNYKEAGTKVELLPKEQVAGKDAIVLLITPKSGSASRAYLDPETYLPIKSVMKLDAPDGSGQIEQTTELSDYRTVDGVKVAFRIGLVNAIQSVTLVFKSVEHNVEIDDAMFGKK